VVEHVERVHHVEALGERGLAHVGQHETRLGMAPGEALDRHRRDVEPQDARAVLEVEAGEEAGAAAHVEHAPALDRHVRIAQRALEHLEAQRVARAVVREREPDLAGAAQVELLAQAALPEFAGLVRHVRHR
jgi:hypothetical protein